MQIVGRGQVRKAILCLPPEEQCALLYIFVKTTRITHANLYMSHKNTQVHFGDAFLYQATCFAHKHGAVSYTMIDATYTEDLSEPSPQCTLHTRSVTFSLLV